MAKVIRSNFFTAKNLKVNITVKSENNFVIKKNYSSDHTDYYDLTFNSYLVFTYNNDSFSLFDDVWFTYHQMYGLCKVLKNYAKLLETKLKDIFIEDDGITSVSVEYKKFSHIVTGINDKKILVRFDVTDKKDETELKGIRLVFSGDKKNIVFISKDIFISLVYTLDSFNLIQLGQTLANNFATQILVNRNRTFDAQEVQEE